MCCAYDPTTKKVVVGTSKGHLQLWNQASFTRKEYKKFHKKGVDAIYINEKWYFLEKILVSLFLVSLQEIVRGKLSSLVRNSR